MTSYLTGTLPGTGGIIKKRPEDFVVEEVPLYLPCGEGEHLYVRVEKKGLTTFDLIDRLGKALGLRIRDIGYAGLKDARATTRQTLSLPGIEPQQVLSLELPGVTVLEAKRHRNKLRLGHLAGNRFTIRVREVAPDAQERALDILHVLQDLGVPNYFGEQRYGALGNSHLIGRAILQSDFTKAARHIVGDPEHIVNAQWKQAAEMFRSGELEGALSTLPRRQNLERRVIQSLHQGKGPKEAVLALPKKMLRLYLSAFQSWLFDRFVAMRIDSLGTLWQGDWAYKHDNGACFLVEDPQKEQPRADRFEISPTAPLFGFKVPVARGQAGILEESLLDKEKLTCGDFRLGGGLGMEGERRPLRVPLTEVEASCEQADLLLSFRLPKGSFATSVLREILKNGQQDGN